MSGTSIDAIEKVSRSTALDKSSIVGATVVTTRALHDENLMSLGPYLAIDVYSSTCEIRKVTGSNDRDYTLESALSNAHEAGCPVLILDSLEINPTHYGAVGDGVADDSVALQAAIDAAGNGSSIYFHRKYTTTVELDFTGKINITCVGPGGINFRPTASGKRSAISLIGADRIVFRDFKLNCGETNPPKAFIAIGRNVDGQGAICQFHNCLIDGYATQAGIYAIAAEINTWSGTSIRLNGGGAKYAVYLSQLDDLSLGGFTSNTHYGVWFNNGSIVNNSTDANAAALYIHGRNTVGNMVFRDIYLSSDYGSVIELYGDEASFPLGPYTFDNVYMEDQGNCVQYVKIDGSDPSTYWKEVAFIRCRGAGSPTYFFYSTDNVIMAQWVLDNNVGGFPSSFYRAEYCTINEHYTSGITFRHITHHIWGNLDRSSLVFEPGETSHYSNMYFADGNLYNSGGKVAQPEEITATDAGVAASVDTLNTEVTTNGDEDLDEVTLADGVSGQYKSIYCVVEGHANDTWKITPTNMIGGTQITFAGVGLGCSFRFTSNGGWIVVENNGGVIS